MKNYYAFCPLESSCKKDTDITPFLVGCGLPKCRDGEVPSHLFHHPRYKLRNCCRSISFKLSNGISCYHSDWKMRPGERNECKKTLTGPALTWYWVFFRFWGFFWGLFDFWMITIPFTSVKLVCLEFKHCLPYLLVANKACCFCTYPWAYAVCKTDRYRTLTAQLQTLIACLTHLGPSKMWEMSQPQA